MSDLTSLILTVAPPKPTIAPGHLGRASHALLLRLISEADPAFAESIHDTHLPKPFTCSTLVGGKLQGKNGRQYLPDDPAWLRFTGLNTAVSTHLHRIAADPPAAIDLDGHIFHIRQATLNYQDHPWAGQTSYEALGAPYLLAERRPDYRLTLSFVSPTTFRSQGRTQPVPMPTWVFGSLMARWNAFSPVQVAKEMRRFAEECVVLSKYTLRTRAVPFKQNVVQMGCVGTAHYTILNRDKYWASMLNMLADYAFYSGIGYQSTVGLGQAQRE